MSTSLLKRLVPAVLAAACVWSLPASGQGFRPSTIEVSDPTLGVPYGSMYLLPGWRGDVHLDHTSDPLTMGRGIAAGDFRSPDGSASLQLLAVPFHTVNLTRQQAVYYRGNPGVQRNAYLGRFTSTADLLTRVILPSLGVRDQPVKVEPEPREKAMATRNNMQQQGVQGPIADGAAVLLHRNGRDLLVVAETFGSLAGGNSLGGPETTDTTLTVWSAPEGKAEALRQAFERLSQQPNGTPAWQHANQQYLAEWRRQMEADSARGREITKEHIANTIAQGNANIAAMQARGAERDRQFALHEQQTSDAGALFRGYLSGTSTTYKWCNGGASKYTVDDYRQPGAGYTRCN